MTLTDLAHPPTGSGTVRNRALAVFALALGGFGIGTTEYVAMGLLPEIAADLAITEPTAGHTISAYALGVVVGAPLFAVLAARVPRKTLLAALMAVFTLGNAASVVASGYGLLVAARFLAGLPHGAYFGVAALVAAHLAGPQRRARAVAQVMLGLSVANVVGVPAASWLGQSLGWRTAFGLVVVIGAATVAAIVAWVPAVSMPVTNPITELGALRRRQVWLTLTVATVGFAGCFAVYTYLATTLTDITGVARSVVPIGLAVYGAGMVVGSLAGGRIADRALIPGLIGGMIVYAVLLGLFVAGARHPVTAFVLLFLIGATNAALIPGLQTRLMDVAAEAQSLAASLNHAALNAANALGAWLGGLVIAAGFGYTAPAAVGAVLALAGVAVLAVSVRLDTVPSNRIRRLRRIR
ncbi:MFS transporter [Rhodococcus phenolicus]|uniref:MFS transporter n=1 Tax=Rhodococcus phenolicus TaxID=263849 RepID=UPI000829FA9E|nr:MFS transporter [Rhodococcus phenolicus]